MSDTERFREQDARRQRALLETLAADDISRQGAARLGFDLQAAFEAADAEVALREAGLAGSLTPRTELPTYRGKVRRKRGVVRPGDVQPVVQRPYTVNVGTSDIAVHGHVPSHAEARQAAERAKQEHDRAHAELMRERYRPLTRAERRAKRKRRK